MSCSVQQDGRGPFRGWIVVWSAFSCLTAIFGASYSFAAFFKPWADEFAATRAEVSWVFGLSSLLYFMLGAVGGALADRFGPRATGVAGVLILAGGLVASSRAGSLFGVYLAYGLGMGLGVALVYTPAMGAVQPWFIKQRGLASGIASAGIGAGTLIVPVLTTWLIDAYGWRAALQLTAAGALLVGVAAAWRLERDPAARGWQADGVPLPMPQAAGSQANAAAMPSTTAAASVMAASALDESTLSAAASDAAAPDSSAPDAAVSDAAVSDAAASDTSASEASAAGAWAPDAWPAGAPAAGASAPAAATRDIAMPSPDMNLRSAASSASFRWLYAAVMISGVPMFVPFAHLSAAARDQGIADATAVALVGLIGIGSLLGRFFIGALADRLGRLQTHVLMQAALGVSFLLWALAGGYPMLAAFALLFGLTYGGIVSLLPPICSDLFGLRAVSGIIGLLYSGAGIGALIGPVAGGALFDYFHHYGATIALCLLGSGVATACAWQLMRDARRKAPPARPGTVMTDS